MGIYKAFHDPFWEEEDHTEKGLIDLIDSHISELEYSISLISDPKDREYSLALLAEIEQANYELLHKLWAREDGVNDK